VRLAAVAAAVASDRITVDTGLDTKIMAKKAVKSAKSTKKKPVGAAPKKRLAVQRRPHAERSASTQGRLIKAAINCLARVGYSQTTVSMVAQEAAVSRGAMTHQYAAKTDLMLAVVAAVFESDAEHHARTVAAMTPQQWISKLPATMWDLLSRPSAIAVMEIMLASRSDRELADKLRAMQAAIDVRSHQWIVDRLTSAGIKDRPDGEAIHRLFVAAVRGLAMEALFRRDSADVEKSVAVLGEILRLLYPAAARALPAVAGKAKKRR
jgi:AcrR family transcriptional regulator